MLLFAGFAAAALLQAAPLMQSELAASTRPYNAATDVAGYAVLHFLSTWRTAWLQGGEWQGSSNTDIRLRDDHCHWDGSFGNSGRRGNAHPPSVIHRSSRRSMCPDWLPADEPAPSDERL